MKNETNKYVDSASTDTAEGLYSGLIAVGIVVLVAIVELAIWVL